jgi:hypothetical protein
MRELKQFWVYDFDEEEEIFARTSWMVPGFDRAHSPSADRLSSGSSRKRDRKPAHRQPGI